MEHCGTFPLPATGCEVYQHPFDLKCGMLRYALFHCCQGNFGATPFDLSGVVAAVCTAGTLTGHPKRRKKQVASVTIFWKTQRCESRSILGQMRKGRLCPLQPNENLPGSDIRGPRNSLGLPLKCVKNYSVDLCGEEGKVALSCLLMNLCPACRLDNQSSPTSRAKCSLSCFCSFDLVKI